MGTRFEDLQQIELTTVGVKFNITDPSGDYQDEVKAVVNWINFCASYHDNYVPEHYKDFGLGNGPKLIEEKGTKYEIMRMVAGLHTEGKTKHPHIHIHALIWGTPNWKKGWRRDNVERQFLKKNKIPKMSVQINTALAEQPSKENLIAYVLKEGKPLCREYWVNISNSDELVLTKFATNIFEASVKDAEYKEEKKKKEKDKLDNLLDLCLENREKYHDLRSMCKWYFLYRRQLKEDGVLTVQDQPDFMKIEKELKKVADWIGIWSYEDGFRY